MEVSSEGNERQRGYMEQIQNKYVYVCGDKRREDTIQKGTTKDITTWYDNNVSHNTGKGYRDTGRIIA